MYDLLLVGGGLAQGLVAWRLAARRPDVRFLVLEGGAALGGNHTWSFHGSDVPAATLEWVSPLVSRSWPAHDVAVGPELRRMGGGYHSIRSEDFAARVMEALGPRVRLGARVRAVEARRVELQSGEVLEAPAVLDGRGFHGAPAWPCGYQKFLGMDVELEAPHGLTVPLVMDTRVPQLEGFRFVYLLPWTPTRVLVEDTVYSDTREVDVPAFRARITEYLAARGLKVKTVEREETAALPIPLSGEAPAFTVPTVGVAGGFFHATTGYSLPFAAQTAEELAALPGYTSEHLLPWLKRRARAHWAQQGFFRLLNRMLFLASAPEERVRVFEAFYQHPEDTIARFYAGRLTAGDVFRVLAKGSNTVPFFTAARAALSA